MKLQKITTREQLGGIARKISVKVNKDKTLALLFLADPVYALEKAGYELSDEIKEHIEHTLHFEGKQAPPEMIQEIERTGKIPWIDNVKFVSRRKLDRDTSIGSKKAALKDDPVVADFDLVVELRKKLIDQTVLAVHCSNLYPKEITYCDYPLRKIYLDVPKVDCNVGSPLSMRIVIDFELEVYCININKPHGEFSAIVELKVHEDSNGKPEYLYIDLKDIEQITVGGDDLEELVEKMTSFPELFGSFPEDFLNDPINYIKGCIEDLLKDELGEIPVSPVTSTLVGFSLPIGEINRKSISEHEVLAITVNFQPAESKGNLAELDNFIKSNRDFSIGIHERIIQQIFEKVWEEMPKRFDTDGNPNPSGNIILQNLAIDLRDDGYIHVEGRIAYDLPCWPFANPSVGFSGAFCPTVSANHELGVAVELNSLSWFSMVMFSLCGDVLWRTMDELNIPMEYELEIPDTDLTMKANINGFHIHDGDMQCDGTLEIISPELLVPPIPNDPPTLDIHIQEHKETEEVGSYNDIVSTLTTEHVDIIKEKYASEIFGIDPYLMYELLGISTDATPSSASWYEQFGPWHEVGTTYRVTELHVIATAITNKLVSDLTYAWKLDSHPIPGIPLLGKNLEQIEFDISPPEGLVVTQGADQSYSYSTKSLSVSVVTP